MGKSGLEIDPIKEAMGYLWPEGWDPGPPDNRLWDRLTSDQRPPNRASAEARITKVLREYPVAKMTTSGKGLREKLNTGAQILEGMLSEFERLDRLLGCAGWYEEYKVDEQSVGQAGLRYQLIKTQAVLKVAATRNPSVRGAGSAKVGPFSPAGIERTPEMMLSEQLWLLWFGLRGVPDAPDAGDLDPESRSEFQKYLVCVWKGASSQMRLSAKRSKKGVSKALPRAETFLRDHAFPIHRWMSKLVEHLGEQTANQDLLLETLGFKSPEREIL